MIGASKILTVSYGTFSCTLEGFDDSFGTMKAIAEYFRDLASDDRYFGAEPPTPDAEMLAKIAGREIKRQVEAKIENNSVTLRPLEQAEVLVAPVEANPAAVTPAQPPVAAPEPAAAPPVVAAPVVNEAPTPIAEAIVVPSFEYDDAQDEAQAELVSPDAPDAMEEVDTESVAAKLRRIRAVVAKNQAAGTAAPIFSEDAHAEEVLPTEDASVEAPFAAAEVAETPVEVEDVVEAEIEDTESEDAESDADISALMSRVSDEAADVEVEVEVETDAVEAPTDSYEDAYEAEADEAGDDDALSNILDAVAKDSGDDKVEIEAEVEIEVEAKADIVATDTADADDAPSEDVAEITADTDADASDDTEAHNTPRQPVVPVRPSRARVIKVKKADLKKGADRAVDAAIAEDQPMAHSTDSLGETNLSAEDEAELLAELADVELELPADTDHGIDTALRVERTARALHDGGGVENEASVTRLLDETNAQLDTDESTRRRSAISHLRAAVAATVAERKFTKSDEPDVPDQVDAYRTDLADVIRPQHAIAKGDQHIDRPAPLILVSEQRIDHKETAAQAAAGPIRPRRIIKSDVVLHEVEKDSHLGLADLSAQNDHDESSDDNGANIFTDSTSFADFAEKMGASELPDLLEAAAAYTAYVEGRPHFARPQIMRQVAGFAGKEEFNREEGLRSFGQLLRQGKIIKIKRGQFEIAQTTRFKPEARFAGE